MLQVRVGQHSEAGRKPANQDFCGAILPTGEPLAAKGVAVAVADGISSSDVSRLASQAAVSGFLADYYCTPDAWSVQRSAERVLAATNSWLFAQTQQGAGRWDKDQGWVCTFSALVVRSRTAHLFHVGDGRIWQVQGDTLEQLTTDHRVHAGGGRSYLGRALGVSGQVEIDYRSLSVAEGDTFVLTTDGVHEHLRPDAIAALIAAHADLDAAAVAIAQAAAAAGSQDNLTVQVVRIVRLAPAHRTELSRQAAELPLPPELAPRMAFEGLRIVRQLHASARSHVWLAVDESSGERMALKVPSTESGADARWRERFLLEEWVARRVDSPHLLKPRRADRPRQSLHVAFEYVEGATLAQWMVDHPRPPLDAVRAIVGQLARGLRALHRLEMFHQDLRPENVMVDATGTARIIDFGAVQVAGIADDEGAIEPGAVPPGTLQSMAPECLRGAPGSARSDLYSLATIAYQMLSGRLPYDMAMVRERSEAAQRRMRYRPLAHLRPDVPAWIDDALEKALHPDPFKRFEDVDEFVHALSQPAPGSRARRRPPLAERNPLLFWKSLSLLLALGCITLLGLRVLGH